MFIAALGIAVLVVAYLALRNPRQNTVGSVQTITATQTVPAPSTPAGSAAPSDTVAPPRGIQPSIVPSPEPHRRAAVGSQPLVVLNAVGTPDLGTNVATQFEDAGWTVTQIADYTNNFLSTAVYYDPSVPGARRAAHVLQRQFPFIKRVVPRFPQLPAGPVVVVLWSDYSG